MRAPPEGSAYSFYLRRANADIRHMAREDCRNAGVLISLAEATEARACEE